MKILSIVQEFRDKAAAAIEVAPDKLLTNVYDNSSGVQFTLEEFVNQYNPEDIQKGQANFIFSMATGNKVIARFVLIDMINCSGIIVNSDVAVSKAYSHKGLGTLINKFCIDFCRYYGYAIIQATDKDSNEIQKKIFLANDWKHITKFGNPKTKNVVSVWMYFLNDVK